MLIVCWFFPKGTSVTEEYQEKRARAYVPWRSFQRLFRLKLMRIYSKTELFSYCIFTFLDYSVEKDVESGAQAKPATQYELGNGESNQ
jgi:hypothetical protein